MEAIGETETKLFFFGVRASFEISDGFDLLFGSAFLKGGNTVCADCVSTVKLLRDADGDEFFIEAWQRAVGQQRFQEAGDTLGNFRAIREDFEHIRNDTARLEECGI